MKKALLIVSSLVLIFGVFGTANASYIHTYTGTNYTQFNPDTGNIYNDTMSVTGFFTTSDSLLPNSSYSLLGTPGFTFSFFDGVNEIKSVEGATSNGWTLETDENGLIEFWSWNAIEPNVSGGLNSMGSSYSTVQGGRDMAAWDASGENYNAASTMTASGVWVSTQSPVPIPGAAWLLGSGLIGIVGIRRKFKK